MDNSDMNITEFLEARIAEDEGAALAAGTAGQCWETMTEETGNGEGIYYTVEVAGQLDSTIADMCSTQPIGRRQSEHIARHDPARVLAECAAKRAIIEQHQTYVKEAAESVGIAFVGARSGQEVTGDVLKLLAAVYRDHPDYQPEWVL